MKLSASTMPRVLLASFFALASFGLGYVAPHRQALAQSPSPRPSMPFDNVPGGVGGHGHALITGASSRLVGNMKSNEWPCVKDDTCTLDVQLKYEPPPTTPSPYSCPRAMPNHCLTFTGKGWQVYSNDLSGRRHPGPGLSATANVAGMIQFTK